MDQTLNRENYITNGQIYKIVLDIEPYHHIPPEITKKWHEAGKKHKADVVIVELGGTVGESVIG